MEWLSFNKSATDMRLQSHGYGHNFSQYGWSVHTTNLAGCIDGDSGYKSVGFEQDGPWQMMIF